MRMGPVRARASAHFVPARANAHRSLSWRSLRRDPVYLPAGPRPEPLAPKMSDNSEMSVYSHNTMKCLNSLNYQTICATWEPPEIGTRKAVYRNLKNAAGDLQDMKTEPPEIPAAPRRSMIFLKGTAAAGDRTGRRNTRALRRSSDQSTQYQDETGRRDLQRMKPETMPPETYLLYRRNAGPETGRRSSGRPETATHNAAGEICRTRPPESSGAHDRGDPAGAPGFFAGSVLPVSGPD